MAVLIAIKARGHKENRKSANEYLTQTSVTTVLNRRGFGIIIDNINTDRTPLRGRYHPDRGERRPEEKGV